MSQQINLFNPIYLKQRKVFTLVPMSEAVGIILVGALALAGYGKYRANAADRNVARINAELAAKQGRLTSVNSEFSPRQKDQQIIAQLAETEARLKSLTEVEHILQQGDLGNTQGYAEYFRALARQHVDGLWLTGVAITGAGSDIAVQGRAMQAPLIANYIARLTAEHIMRGKTFSSLAINRPPPVAPVASAEPAAGSGTVADKPATPAVSPFVDFSLQSTVAADTTGTAVKGGAR